MITVSTIPHSDDPSDDHLAGKNRFECRSCPYQYVLNKRYYERKMMKRKEVEDIMGGKGSWDNVDKTNGIYLGTRRKPDEPNLGLVLTSVIVQCPNERCNNNEAFFYLLQIRSADEPMTAFYKVCSWDFEGSRILRFGEIVGSAKLVNDANELLVYKVWEAMEGVGGCRWRYFHMHCNGVHTGVCGVNYSKIVDRKIPSFLTIVASIFGGAHGVSMS